jgi:apolipoprotein N-acyltransferase
MATSSQLMQPSTPTTLKKPQVETNVAPPRAIPLPCLLPALASGAILWMCYHPLAWGWLGWIALVPLLCLVRSERRPRAIYFAGLAGGMLFYTAALQWMRVADGMMYATWISLALYCALYFPAAVWLTRALERRTRLPLVVTFPAVWVALEYVRAFLLTGFPWFYLAHSQHDHLTIIQITDLGGAFAVSLLVVAVNALIFDLLYQVAAVRARFALKQPAPGHQTFLDDWPELGGVFFASWRRGILIDGCAVAVLVTAAGFYGNWRLGQDTVQQGPAVALIQGNIDQRLRNQAPSDKKQLTIAKHYADLCQRVLDTTPEVELFIWPETSFPLGWFEMSRAWQPNFAHADDRKKFTTWRAWEAAAREGVQDWGKGMKHAQLLGINAFTLDATGKEVRHNTALLINANGSAEARYDKMHRVPFGEYVPLKDWLPFMNQLSPYDYDYSIRAGEKLTRFELDNYRFGVLVCYEDSDPFLARRYVGGDDADRPVDFLVNISNDGWFDGTSEHETHLAVSRFRAIECRRAMVRAVNMGISALIDGNGRVLRPDEQLPNEHKPKLWAIPYKGIHADPLPEADWASFKKVAGVLVARVPIDDRFSLYALAGDWLPYLCWLLIAVGTVGTWIVARLRKRPMVLNAEV